MSKVVKSYYDENAEIEWDRLGDAYNKVEFCSTMYLINKYFPNNGSIVDIGCGPGRYSIELLKKGYKVTLFELSEKELHLAKEKVNSLGLKAEDYICDSAINLNRLESGKFDAVLLMGPMYHVLNDDDRNKILKETMRILKKDGVTIIAYLNSWGILKAGVTQFNELFKDLNNVYAYLGDQKFDEKNSFTEVYFSTPPKAIQEVKNAGFEIISYAGTEGFLSGIQTELTKLCVEKSEAYDNLVKVASETCEAPQYRDATEHLHIVAQKNNL